MMSETSVQPAQMPIGAGLLDSMRVARSEFEATIEPLRPRVWAYCRRLTGDVWDADDLVQETLARAFAFAARTLQPIERPLPWLLRVATNAYVDSRRRPAPTPTELAESPAPAEADPVEVRDALAEVTALLPPQERAALVLKDVFELPLTEIAGMLDTSVGAVKAALHRGRGRLSDRDGRPGDGGSGDVGPGGGRRRALPDRAVLDSLAAAFTAYDLDRLTALLAGDVVSEVPGAAYEVGRDAVRDGSMTFALNEALFGRYRCEVRELDGEALLVFWVTSDPSGEYPANVVRVETLAGLANRLHWYFYEPETLAEVGDRLGIPMRTHGYAPPQR